MFNHNEFDHHEEVTFINDPTSGLRAIIVVHDTTLGPAFGGCRMHRYGSETEALNDALRLARSMTAKAAICDLPYGGGKSVIIGDPRTKTRELLLAMGRAVDDLGGRYIIADDVGTTLSDLAVMREVTRHTAAATSASAAPLAATAHGVMAAIRAAVAFRLDRGDLAGLGVAVQGLGHVGGPLAALLKNAGARLVVADLDATKTEAARKLLGAEVVEPSKIYDQPVDLFAPCAHGAILNETTILRLKAAIVVGGANNQLADQSHDALLAARGILYVPDYIANAGGVIDYHQEGIDDRPDAVLQAVDRLHDITKDVLEAADRAGMTPLFEANQRVALRLRHAREAGQSWRARRDCGLPPVADVATIK